jgi:hypothetical protein
MKRKMDKKGFTSPLLLMVLLIVIVCLIPVKYGDVSLQDTINVLNKTESNLASTFQNPSYSSDNEATNIIIQVVYKYIDFIAYSSFELAKLAIIWGDQYLGAQGVWIIFWLIMLSLSAPVVVVLVKLIIIFSILIYDIIKGRKEKKELKRLRKEKDG